jgi:hypothetical protein
MLRSQTIESGHVRPCVELITISITSFCDDQGTYCTNNVSSQKCSYCKHLQNMGSPLPHTADPPIALPWPSPAFGQIFKRPAQNEKLGPKKVLPSQSKQNTSSKSSFIWKMHLTNTLNVCSTSLQQAQTIE